MIDYYGQARDEMLPYIPSNCKTLLEIGCGSGKFAYTLKQRFPSLVIWGIEPNGAAASLANARGLDKVLESSIEDAYDQLPDKYFDCILCNDVLEHLPDPDGVLMLIKSKLSPTGVIVGSIPNVRYYPVLHDLLFHRDWKYVEHGVLDKTHLRFYTRISFSRMMENTGFDICTLNGIHPTTGLKANFFAKLLPFFDDVIFRQYAFVVTPKIGRA